MIVRAGLLCLVFCLAAQAASAAGAIRCTDFLHMRDGSWRAFNTVDVLGPNGTVHVDSGSLLSATDRSAKGDVARALNGLCE